MSGDRAPAAWRAGVMAVLLAGFGLSLYRLGYQAALGDDAFTLVIASREVGDLLRLSASEPHPPVFYLLMWVWQRLVGDGEFAGRFVAVWWAVAATALTYHLGRRLTTPALGALAALILAVNPFFLAYAQQARMYAMVVALCVSSFILMDLLQRGDQASPGRRRTQVAYVLVTLLAVATHFFALFAVAAQSVIYITQAILHRDRARLVEWLTLQAAWALAYLPWVVAAYPTLSTYRNELVSPVGLVEAYGRTLIAYVAGDGPPVVGIEVAIVAAAAVALLGLAASIRGRDWIAPGYALLPPALVFLVSLVRPMYFERYMMVALPGFCLLIASGVAALGQWRRFLVPLALAGPLAAAVLVLPGYYAQTRYATAADMRAMVGYLTALAEPGAAVVSNLPPSDPTLAYYYRGSWPLTYLPESGDAAQIERRLADLAVAHTEIWYLPYGAEKAVVEPWLDGHAARVTDQWYSDARLIRYVLPSAATGVATPVDARLDNGVTLSGWRLLAPAPRSGQPLLVQLAWTALRRVGADYKVSLQLLDDSGTLWGQWDGQPGNGLKPTSSWAPGKPVSDTIGLLVLPGTPAGAYRLMVGMYDGATGRRANLEAGGDLIQLATVTVGPSSRALEAAAYQIPRPLDFAVPDGLRLVGASVRPLGLSEEASQFRAGAVIHVTLFWRGDGRGAPSGAPRLVLSAANAAEITGAVLPAPGGSYAPDQWRAGEIVRQQVNLFVPAGAAPGAYHLTLTWGSVTLTLVDVTIR